MRPDLRKPLTAGAVSVILTAMASVSTSAQQAPPKTRTGTRPAAEVLAQIGQSAGVVVLADSTIWARLPVPAAAASPATVEQQIGEAVRALPPGTVAIKLYVPAPASGRWNGDIVAEYARARARLVGASGRPAPEGTVELFGRYLPRDRASEVIQALDLKLVYLVTNPRAAVGADTASDWSRLSPEQRRQYIQQQAQRFLALDPAARIETVRQMMRDASPQQAILKAMIGQMTDAERVQLKQALSSGTKQGSKPSHTK